MLRLPLAAPRAAPESDWDEQPTRRMSMSEFGHGGAANADDDFASDAPTRVTDEHWAMHLHHRVA
jgi:hypothetical protein